MLEATIITSVIAALAGAVTYYSWQSNKALASLTAVVCAVSAALAVLLTFLGALALVLRIIPVLLLGLGIWLVWKVLRRGSGRDRNPRRVE